MQADAKMPRAVKEFSVQLTPVCTVKRGPSSGNPGWQWNQLWMIWRKTSDDVMRREFDMDYVVQGE